MAGGCVLPSWVWAWYMPTTVPEKVNTVAISPLKILVQWVNPHLLVLSSYIPSSFLYASDVSDDITHIDKYADNISICSPEVHILKWEKTLSQLLFWQDHALGMSGIGKKWFNDNGSFSLKRLPCYQDMLHSVAHACANHFDLWWNATSILGHRKLYNGLWETPSWISSEGSCIYGTKWNGNVELVWELKSLNSSNLESLNNMHQIIVTYWNSMIAHSDYTPMIWFSVTWTKFISLIAC